MKQKSGERFLENKCPHCGKEMPKSAAFCMHCMRAREEKKIQLKPPKKSNKKVLILCACALAVALTAAALWIALGHKQEQAVNTVEPAVSSTAASAATTAPTTQKQTSSTKKKAKTTKEQTTKKDTTQATAAEQPPQNTPAQPATRAPATTAASTDVVIDGSALTDYPNTKTDSSYTIPYAVSSISSGAFHGNPYLRTLKFSKRTNVSCNWSNLFANLPNLETIYIYTGTSADTQGMQYFDGEIIYYYD